MLDKFFKRLFKSTGKNGIENDHEINTVSAKEKQAIFVKSYLKPTLKQHGYLTSGQTWWRDQGDFYLIINLQNFSWNTKNDVNFCFNIGIALKSQIKDISKKPSYSDLTIFVRDGAYLSDLRNTTVYKNKTGYFINESTDLDDFINEAKIDFESEILPTLDRLKTINDCVEYYSGFPFWGDRLKEIVKNGNQP